MTECQVCGGPLDPNNWGWGHRNGCAWKAWADLKRIEYSLLKPRDMIKGIFI